MGPGREKWGRAERIGAPVGRLGKSRREQGEGRVQNVTIIIMILFYHNGRILSLAEAWKPSLPT